MTSRVLFIISLTFMLGVGLAGCAPDDSENGNTSAAKPPSNTVDVSAAIK